MNHNRGTVRTRQQMKAAPSKAIFVWCTSDTRYPRELARMIKREDLEIVGKDWLSSQKWRGLEFSGIVIDHAAALTTEEQEVLRNVMTRIK